MRLTCGWFLRPADGRGRRRLGSTRQRTALLTEPQQFDSDGLADKNINDLQKPRATKADINVS
ncbi:hypothetical protein GCM10020220_000710 [Nonomuraea rubra]